MSKIPDFSKFDFQGIVNSVKSMINPETTPNVAEGDPIGSKIVQISSLLKNVASIQTQSTKDLNNINRLLNELYKDLEAFRQLETELRFKQQTEGSAEATSVKESNPASGVGEPSQEKIEKPASEETKTKL